MIRQAEIKDLETVAGSYLRLLTYEKEQGGNSNWVLGVYPTKTTAETAIEEQTLYVLEEDGTFCGSMILNKKQPPEYGQISWRYPAADEDVMVIHTLCIPPEQAGKGRATQLVRFALQAARESGCTAIRLDTWAGNRPAAALYEKMGFHLAGTAPILLQGLIPEDQIFFERRTEEGT